MKILNIARDISCFLVVLIIFSCSARNVKTEKDVAYAQKIDSLMTKSYERGLFNGNVLVAKKEKSSIKNHLVLPMKREKHL